MTFDPDLYLGAQPAPEPEQPRSDGIAIIGMAGRFPGAQDIGEFWANLRAGTESVTFFPPEELELPPWMKCSPDDPNLIRAAGVLEDADCFDAEFFGYSKREAAFIDPQQRVFLECCWSAVEFAGYDPVGLPGVVGVFGSTVPSTYMWMHLAEADYANPAERMLTNMGNMEDSLATRVAYKLNLKGPALTVQTACSSSLVAVNMACESLLNGKCGMALAGGVCITFPQKAGYVYNPDLIDSRDGHCCAFSEGATGTIFSNGAGVILLKRLEDARRDGDTIHAVILGSAINNDGCDKIGYTAPSVSGQAEVIRQALAQAGVKPKTIGCIEAHGTGTPLGDPIEIAALAQAFEGSTLRAHSCAIGSVKTNVGHLTAAAGIAGIIKAVLALKHREIPASLNFSAPNAAIPFDKGPFYVNQRLQAWKRGATPLRAGVSSFGIGGTNAHVILEEGPPTQKRSTADDLPWHLVTFSARTAEALERKVRQFDEWLAAQPEWPDIGSVAFTLNTGRTHFAHRLAIVAAGSEDLSQKLKCFPTGPAPDCFWGRTTPVPGAEAKGACADGNTVLQRLRSLAAQYVQGGDVDWSAVHPGAKPNRIPLPTYPFAKERHWWRSSSSTRRAESPEPKIKRLVRRSDPVVEDHRVLGEPVFPGVAYLEMVYAEAAACGRGKVRAIEEIHWLRTLGLGDRDQAELEIHFKPNGARFDYTITAGALTYALGTLAFDEAETASRPASLPLEEIRARCSRRMHAPDFYRRFAENGLVYGPSLQTVREVWHNDSESLALIELSAPAARELQSTALHPGVMDAALQTTAMFVEKGGQDGGGLSLPYSVKSIEIVAPLEPRVFAYATRVESGSGGETRRFNIVICNERGDVLIRIDDLFARVSKPAAPARRPAANPEKKAVVAIPAASLEQVENSIRRHVATALDVPENELDPEQNYTEVGVDSLLAVEIVKAINAQFALSLRTTDLFSYTNFRQLAGRVIELLGDRPADGGASPEAEEPAAINVTYPAPEPSANDIAIIGMAGRFPDAENTDEFWANLKAGRNSVREVPGDRWDWRQFHDEDPRSPNRTNSKWGAFLDGVDEFDPLFFNLSPKEAAMMDPQQRLFLEEAWKALEDAGYGAANLGGARCGVFAGVLPGDYGRKMEDEGVALNGYAFTGNCESILAARIAYFLNLKGPSVALDTACSASLVAVHLGCQSILAGDSDMVVAGGVYLMMTPRFHILSSKAGMLSPGGACKAFDRDADGIVPGEGAGAVVLKRLDLALRDGDPIHGVIKASGINQDGRSNGITAPSSLSQTALELEVYRKAAINPETISMVETHGTGTKLGDPIELNALADAFAQHTSKTQFCALGSVKTNIGHLMAASGIASLIKVLLAFRHRQMPPSLHFRQPSEHFEFPRTPFFVNQQLRDWPATPGQPRRAAVSSFGFSGTNAHVVIEEPPAMPAAPDRKRPHLFAISAPNEEALRRKISELERWLDAQGNDLRLQDLSYTLNCRRTHFECRVALVAQTREELIAALRTSPGGQPASTDRTAANREALGLVEELSTSLDDPACRQTLAELGELYAQGAEIPWIKLYPEGGYRSMRTPAYPFARLRCGNDEPHAEGAVFTKTLHPSEEIVSGHRFRGRCLMPGAGFVEMALAAAESAQPGSRVRKLLDVRWLAPLEVGGEALELRVNLKARGAELDWEITSHGKPHCRGRSLLRPPGEFPEIETVDLQSVRARCIRRFGKDEIYAAFESAGLTYGPWFRIVEKIEAGATEALSDIVLQTPSELETYALHPAILDAALQSIGGIQSADSGTESFLPYSIEEIEILGKLTPRMHAWVRPSETAADSGSRLYHIALLNRKGGVVVKLKNFCVRKRAEAKASEENAAPARDGMNPFYRLVWEPRPLSPAPPVPSSAGPVLIIRAASTLGLAGALAAEHKGQPVVSVFLGRRFEKLGEHTFAIDHTRFEDWQRLARETGPCDGIYFLAGLDSEPQEAGDLPQLEALQQRGVLSLLRLARAFELHARTSRSFLKIVNNDVFDVGPADNPAGPAFASLCGFAKVLARECSRVAVSCIDISRADLAVANPREAAAALASRIRSETALASETEVAFRAGERFVKTIAPVALGAATEKTLPLRRNGVYLILGGAGGIGLEVTKWLIDRVQARVILIGRKPLDAARSSEVASLSQRGGEILYLEADGTNLEAMSAAVRQAKARFGAIHGVIHSALVLRDGTIANMDEAAFRAAFDVKVAGSAVLYEATREEPLDFFVFFSSAGSLFGNPGQANYSAGCAFEDAFGLWLRHRHKTPVKVINWGLWAGVGIVASETYQRRLAKQGIYSFDRLDGIAAFEQILAASETQVAAIKVDPKVLPGAGRAASDAPPKPDSPSLTRAAISEARRAMKTIPLPVGMDGQVQARLEEYARLALLHTFQKTWSWLGSGEFLDVDGLQSRLRVLPSFHRLFLALLDILEKGDSLQRDGGRVSIPGPPVGSGHVESLRRDILEKMPRVFPFVRLVDACLEKLPEVLRGEITGPEVMFPGGSAELVESVYRGNEAADYYNQIMAGVVSAWVAESLRREPGKRLRLLEIGAGTGGTTEGMLERFAPHGEALEYYYTDISPIFTRLGKKQFGRHAFVRFALLDIEKDLATQKFAAGDFDAVIASNVLHATKNMRDTMRQVKRLLKPGGLLALNEGTGPLDFVTATFGLTEGWWRFEDAELRCNHSPLLASARWRQLLAEESFQEIDFMGIENFEQHVIVCESPAQAVVKETADPGVELLRPAAEFIWKAFVEVLKVDRRELERGVDAISFEKYGVDSMGAMELIDRLEKDFGALPKTLLFEHATLRSLTGYFLEHHRETLLEKAGLASPLARTPSPAFHDAPRPAAMEASPNRSFAPAGPSAPGSGDFAIIGISGRYPLANNLDEFWTNLSGGRNCITEIPPERWNHSDVAARFGDMSYSKWGGFIDDVDKFDPLFFNISPREAECMDPQERLFLETAWAAVEDAGYTRFGIDRKTGVFAGVMYGSYQLFGAEEWANKRYVTAGSGYWSIANRVSYVLDLCGPSMAVDTACSSSLTAIHLACESLRRGECRLAIAGGVNLILHPLRYLHLCQMKMLSHEDKCRPFGKGADGFVDGEGVGAVVLKPLEDAVRDGDDIRAVIKGSAINAGGRTHGFTVPNPNAQATLVIDALAQSGIDPRTLGYLEAHGTGTSLGDPIEISGLAQAFRKATADAGFCAIGSVKSNIGHLEAAAGIAGLTKVLLMMKHRKLAPSLHADDLNPLIEFEKTPFRVQRSLEDWTQPLGGRWPRRAGISSFGAGGSNAHLIVEEYSNPRGSAADGVGPDLMILSARNPARLKEYAGRLREFVLNGGDAIPALRDIAYTLQTGREAFEERLAILTTGRQDLLDKLDAFLKGERETEGVFTGNAKSNPHRLATLQDSPEEKEFMKALQRSGQWEKIAAFWVAGSTAPWGEMPRGTPPRRVSVPGYPFARERYWVATGPAATESPKGPHPLVDRNISTLKEIRFQKEFIPADWILRDHQINGHFVLPGAAYLEMARAAAELAGGLPVEGISNVVWLEPIMTSGEPVTVFATLSQEEGRLQFEITTGTGEARRVHSRGKVLVGTARRAVRGRPGGASLPKEIRERCPRQYGGDEIYRRFDQLGLRYGPGFQVIRNLWANGEEVLAELRLPPFAAADFAEWGLHPSLMDGALQATVGFALGEGQGALHLPFSLRNLSLHKPLTEACYAHVRLTDSPNGAHSPIRKFQITLMDEDGSILVDLEDFGFRLATPPSNGTRKPGGSGQAAIEETPGLPPFYYQPVWNPAALEPLAGREQSGQPAVLLVLGGGENITRRIRQLVESAPARMAVRFEPDPAAGNFEQSLDQAAADPSLVLNVLHLWNYPGEGTLRQQIDTGVNAIFRMVKSVATRRIRNKIRLLFVHPIRDGLALPQNCAVAGLALSAQKEMPRIVCKSIQVDPECTSEERLAELAFEELAAAGAHPFAEIRYEGERRFVRGFAESPKLTEGAGQALALRKEGVYLITGGLGGLGRIFARHLAENHHARLILTGRSPVTPDGEEFLQSLATLGGEALYRAGDVTDAAFAAQLVGEAKQRFGALHGIIHSAGVIEDAFILKKTPESIARVLAPKIFGTVAWDEATRAEKLDFFALFSSMVSAIGNAGQSDYAAANRFLDAFAESREGLRGQGKRHGRSLSINWPLWKEGGMRVPEKVEEMLLKTGLRLLSRTTGLRAFAHALRAEGTQIGVADCEGDNFRRTLCGGSAAPAVAPARNGKHAPAEWTSRLAGIFSSVLKVKPAELDEETDLGEYGIDSILLTEVLSQLEKQCGVLLDAAVLLENPTIKSLARFLGEQGFSVRGSAAPAVIAVSPAVSSPSGFGRAPEPIAIISMACRLPGANTVGEFWENLKAGKNSITEVPKDRWDTRTYYDPDKKALRKSYSKWGGFISGIDMFDARFFGLSDTDAITMDPQHRILLELAQDLFDNGGFSRAELRRGRTGIFLGGAEGIYGDSIREGLPDHLAPHMIVNTIQNMMAGRIANFYDLRGPVLTLDTACSSSLVAIHQACQSLYLGECDMAIAGGMTLLLDPYAFIGFCKAGALADTPVPHVFDERSNGFVMGEGAGMVLLKPLSKAMADGDLIHGVLLGSAVNNDGQTMGLTTPNLEAQKAVLEEAYRRSGIGPETISYLEAHGTGTLLGDPIEVKAATQVFAARTPAKQFCGLGSVKSNMGHTFHAAGVAAFMKAILSVRHGLMPPTLHCETPHPRFRFSESPFFPVQRLTPFPRNVESRRAAVSAFGFGGTNCHIVVEEFDAARHHYQPKRSPLPPTQFKRRRFWLTPGAVEVMDDTREPVVAPRPPAIANGTARAVSRTLADRIEELLVADLAESLKIEPSDIDVEASFDELGLDSTALVQMARTLEQKLAIELYPTLLFEYVNLRQLSQYFAQNEEKAFERLFATPPPPVPFPTSRLFIEPEPDFPNGLAAAIEAFLMQRVAAQLAVSVEEVSPETNFMEMGVDSVSLVAVAREMEQEIGVELYPTLFFEYQNIRDLAEYFASDCAEAFTRFLKGRDSHPAESAQPAPAEAPPRTTAPRTAAPAKPDRTAPQPVNTHDIAIIGMAGRFPGSRTVEEFWAHLKNGTDLLREVPPDHWDIRPWFDPRPQITGKSYCKHGGFLDDVDKFDASFFRVSSNEAKLMDPQLRILLEVLHTVAEDAGYAGSLRGTRTGVYMGACFEDYILEMLRLGKEVDPFDGTGNALTMFANRPSYFWDLRGPSISVDTACSSSLVALHLACQALRNGECDMAFAGGANMALTPRHYTYFCSIGALSPTGRCHTFDSRADGYVPGEAVAAVLLKPLAKALEDGDVIHAVIKGSAINHGGYTNTVTAPSPKMEAEVLLKAWQDAGIAPETLGYIEAHGTGTKLGDPIEIQGLTTAFRQHTDKAGFCAIGSAKAHIGHAEGAAGIAGVIKAVLSLKHRQIPAMPAFKELNPIVRLEGSPLYINRAVEEWAAPGGAPLRAGVSSFGFGGAYAHAVIEEYSCPGNAAAPAQETPELFLFSAANPERLRENIARFKQWLEIEPSAALNLANIAYTLQTGREHFKERFCSAAATKEDLAAKLDAFLRDSEPAANHSNGAHSHEKKTPARRPLDGARVTELAESGEWEALGSLWAGGENIVWSDLYRNAKRRRVSLPTYCFARQSHWHTETPAAGAKAQVNPPLPSPAPAIAPPAPRDGEMRAFLKETIAALTDAAPAEIEPSTLLEDLGFDSILGMQLIRQIQEKFSLQIYASEASKHITFGALAAYLEDELAGKPAAAPAVPSPLEIATPHRLRPLAPIEHKLEKPVLFILSAPRSGSTLLRVMLGGHSHLFSPPELHLLPFQDLAERRRVLAPRGEFLLEGLTRAVMELKDLDAQEAAAFLAELEKRPLPTLETYRLLEELCGDRLLVDKSPSYGNDLELLRRAEAMFAQPRYLFITRHPFAVMESFVRNRFDRLLDSPAADPWSMAEEVWSRTNRNIAEFLSSVPRGRRMTLQYETLVTQPEGAAREICAFLDLPFEPAILRPYEGERMRDGVHDVSLAIGDPNFLTHERIEPGFADGWRKRLPRLPDVRPETARVARKLGYALEMPAVPTRRLTPVQADFLASYPACPRWNVVYRMRLDENAGLERRRFELAWQKIIRRHPQLQTFFIPSTGGEDGAFKQVTRAVPENFSVEWLDFSMIPEDQLEVEIAARLDLLNASLDPRAWPLMKVTVASLGEKGFELLWVCHHLVTDGRSCRVILQELFAEYRNPDALPTPPAATYEDYRQALDLLAADPATDAHTEFWKPHTTPGPAPAFPNRNGATFATEREFQARFDCEAPLGFNQWAVALYRTLAGWFGWRAPVISHRLHGRNLPGHVFDGIVGLFAFDVPLRLAVDPDIPTDALVERFSDLFSRKPAGGATYPILVAHGKLPPPNEVAPMRLNYQPMDTAPFAAELTPARLSVKTFQPAGQLRPYLIDFIVRELPEQWTVFIRYSSDIHDEASISGLFEQWRLHLDRFEPGHAASRQPRLSPSLDIA